MMNIKEEIIEFFKKEILEMLKQILKESEIDIIQGLDKNKVRNLIKKATTI